MFPSDSVWRAPLEPGDKESRSAWMVHSKPQTCRGTTHNPALETQRNKDVWGDYGNTKGDLSGPYCLHSFSLFGLGGVGCLSTLFILRKYYVLLLITCKLVLKQSST